MDSKPPRPTVQVLDPKDAADVDSHGNGNARSNGATVAATRTTRSETAHEYPIETRGLTKRFPRATGWRSIFTRGEGKLALDNIDLSVRRGEIFGLLGPNGAGKTTFMKVLSGLLLPDSGTAAVAGFDIVKDSIEVRKRIGLVHGDERTFFWRLSVLENLRFYATLYRIPRGEADERIKQLLDLVGLADSTNTRMDRFSTGMKQRAAIARGLLNDPEILLMDEPTRTLDPVASRDIRNFIRERVTEGGRRTVLLATNLMAEGEQLCDRLAMVNRGQMCFAGTIDELRHTIQVELVHKISVSGIEPEKLRQLAALPAVLSITVTPASRDRYEIDLGATRESPVVPQVIRRIVDAGGQVWSSNPRELSLEELFHEVMGGNGAAPAEAPEGAAL
jgi:ABC-2 type transport system ATP-binding protein